MAYVVAGVSGHTGRVVAETLLAKGSKVRVVVRDAAKGEPWAKKGAEVAIADLGDEAALAKALAGATGAYLLVPPIMGVPDMRAAQAKTLAVRAELHGETAFCYLKDAAPVVANLKDHPTLRFLHRRANLEDLFLKLTGREMRE